MTADVDQAALGETEQREQSAAASAETAEELLHEVADHAAESTQAGDGRKRLIGEPTDALFQSPELRD